MSIAIINASISGTCVIGGTSTLTGALISGSTLNAQGITSTTLNLTNNLVQSGIGNIASGTGGISCNANLVVSGNAIINSNCNVAGNINLTTFGLVAGSTTITNTQLGYISGATSNIQTQLNTFTTVPTLLGQTNAWTGLNTYNTTLPISSISATTSNQLCNKTYTDLTATTAGTTATTNLKGATNTWTGVNNFNNNVVLPIATYLSDAGLFIRGTGDSNNKLQYNATSDGPALQGLSGGRLGTVAKPDILTWNTNSSINTVNVSGNTILIGNVSISGNTFISGNVNILPYTTATILSAYQLNCNAVTCLGQVVASGSGVLTTKLQCSANGTGILGLQCGTYTTATNGNQTVSFPNSFLGSNNPIVFLQPVYASATTGTAYVISTSLTSFTYRFFFDGSVNSESAVSMFWSAYQI